MCVRPAFRGLRGAVVCVETSRRRHAGLQAATCLLAAGESQSNISKGNQLTRILLAHCLIFFQSIDQLLNLDIPETIILLAKKKVTFSPKNI